MSDQRRLIALQNIAKAFNDAGETISPGTYKFLDSLFRQIIRNQRPLTTTQFNRLHSIAFPSTEGEQILTRR
jgi:hypothetical protein